MLRPVVATMFSAIEHYEGQLSALGDALGTDCVVVRVTDEDGRKWARGYTNDGARNVDWYGWLQPTSSFGRTKARTCSWRTCNRSA